MFKNVTTWGYNIPKLMLQGPFNQSNVDIGDSSLFQYIKNGFERSGIIIIQSSTGTVGTFYASTRSATEMNMLRFYTDNTKLMVTNVTISLNANARAIYTGHTLAFESVT